MNIGSLNIVFRWQGGCVMKGNRFRFDTFSGRDTDQEFYRRRGLRERLMDLVHDLTQLLKFALGRMKDPQIPNHRCRKQ